MRHPSAHRAAAVATILASLFAGAGPALAATTFATNSITTDNFTANGNLTFNDASADSILIGQNGGTPDTVQIAGDVSLLDSQWAVTAAGASTFASVNGLTFAANADGFTVGGGTTPRTLNVTGGNIIFNSPGGSNVVVPTTGTLATLASTETLSNKTLASPKISTSIFDTNGNEFIDLGVVASAVNQLLINNAATGSSPLLGVNGNDANIGLILRTKGTGDLDIQTDTATTDVIRIRPSAGAARFTGTITSGDLSGNVNWTFPANTTSGNILTDDSTNTLTNKMLTAPRMSSISDTSGNTILSFGPEASAVNFLQIKNSFTTGYPVLAALGADANIRLILQAKGTGDVEIKTTVANSDVLRLLPASGGAAVFGGTLTSADLTADRTWTLQNDTGLIPLATTANALFFTTTGATNVTLPTSGTLLTSASSLDGSKLADGSVTAKKFTTAATDLGAADLTVNFSNANGSFKTHLVVDGQLVASELTGDTGALKVTAVGTGALTLTTANTNTAAAHSGGISIVSGSTSNAVASNTGNISIDAGPVLSAGTAGTITLAGTNASGLLLGRGGLNVSVPGSLTVGTGGTPIQQHLSQTFANVTSASINVVTCADYASLAFTGAAVGDTVEATPLPATNGIEDVSLSWNGFVSAANTVVIRACNPTAGAIDTDNTQTWRVDLWKH